MKKQLIIFNNFLDQNLLKEINNFALSHLHLNCWRTSHFWKPVIKRATAPISILEIPEKMNKLIQEIFRKKSLKWKNLNIHCMFYLWPPGSYIGWHYDNTYKFGATIYLNEKWNIDHGGLFMYMNKNNIKAITPVYNQCIVPVKTKHSVTLLTPDSDLRRTIQIFNRAK